MRLVEIRLLEGPNLYRLEPVVRIEVAVGRRHAWMGDRDPAGPGLGRLGRSIPSVDAPLEVETLAAWARRLRREHGERTDGLAIHRSSDPGRWVVTFPWSGYDRAREIATWAVRATEASVSPRNGVHVTGTQERLLGRAAAAIDAAGTAPPTWIRDDERRMPIVSISGTNGKSTVTRLVTHILRCAGRHVGTTTSDGVLVDERMVEPGDWTGPGGAGRILGRSDVDVAVLETARGGILLRGVGYESNDVSVLTNVSADHLDLQGIHTLAELAEVKATICRITRPDGRVVLNADDRHVAAVARRVRAAVAFFSAVADGGPVARRHLARGGLTYLVTDGVLVEADGDGPRPILAVRDIPIALGGLAPHNVANAQAAAAAARGLGVSLDDVAAGLRDLVPSPDLSPGRLNIFRLGSRLVVVDFAHNEAGVAALLDTVEALAGGGTGRSMPVTVIVGTAGDRPDDALRGIGRIVGSRLAAHGRAAIKETRHYLRGRSREDVVGRLLEGMRAGGYDATVPVYEGEVEALRGELAGPGASADAGRPNAPRIVVLLCHEARDDVFRYLDSLGARPVDVAAELTDLLPRLRDAR